MEPSGVPLQLSGKAQTILKANHHDTMTGMWNQETNLKSVPRPDLG